MTATSSHSWCAATVSGNKVTVKVSANQTTSTRSATVYVTYRNSRSQTVTVSQKASPVSTVNIGGVEWAKYNVNTPGTVVASLPSALTGNRADSHGRFYQWNRKVAWATTGSIRNWNTSVPSGNTWETANNPCPSGFVVPTKAQFDNLINECSKSYNGGWNSSNYGYVTLTNGTSNLEFVAVGMRQHSDGSLFYNGVTGDYWSSTQDGSEGSYRMNFGKNSIGMGSSQRQVGFSVRCVRK